MMYSFRFGRRGCFDLKPAFCAAAILSLAVAGCSADVTRFDSSSFNFDDPPDATAAVPANVEPVRGSSDFDSAVSRTTPRGPYGAGAGGVDVAALPDASPDASAPPSSYAPVGAAPSEPPPARHAMAAPSTDAAGKGDVIEVQPGDTLYRLSRRHQVSLTELMAVNGLTGPQLKPGQKLHLPAGGSAQAGAAPMAAATPAMHQPASPRVGEIAAPPIAPPSSDVAAKYNGSYTVKPGDSLYNIARQHKVSFAELQQVNGIADPRKVMPGTTLKIPGGSTGGTVAASMPEPAAAAAAAATAAEAQIPAASTQATILNSNRKVAALNATANDASPAASASPTPAAALPAPAAQTTTKADKVANAAPQAAAQASDQSKLRWPAQGKVIAGFGGRPDGTHNDGINLSVPLGTDVHAAEGGVVAYAGSELKGYGNLVLLRHDNGWVTAYAHNDELLVKRGDKVKRGHVIAKAGKSGSVDQPQVHFELRQGSKPVDPVPFLERL